jgi:CelD/BcsL family acetyltransferase involved in cellulose biosynthesis
MLTLKRGESLAGVLPLEWVNRALRAPTNDHTPSFAGVFVDRGAALTLATAALAHTHRRLELSHLDATSHLAAAVHELGGRRDLLMHGRVAERSPYLALPHSEAEFEAALSAKRRSALRRLRRRLAERGDVAVEVLSGDENLDELLAEGFAVERSGWKGERGTAIASQEVTRRFYVAIAHWLAERGWLRLAFLRLGGRAIAFDFAAEMNGAHFLIKTGYGESLRSLAPGLILRYEMIRRSISNGCESYEFLGSDMPWKRIWTDTAHDRLQLHVFPASLQGRADWLVVARVLPLARRVRSRAREARAAAAHLVP